MNLQKLFELQRKLDEHIEQEHPRQEGEDRLAKKILALQVELGELANEWRGFKYWSNNQEPRTVEYCPSCGGSGFVEYFDPFDAQGHIQDQCMYCEGDGTTGRMPLLEEYVDCLHFILSIGLEIGFVRKPMNYLCGHNLIKEFNTMFYLVSKFYEFYFRYGKGCGLYDMYEEVLGYFLGFGVALGFTLEQIEEAYCRKNEINHARQVNKY
jgi:dimeric dUTPase (all-alpha-NTP-PPase superfamily)